jgi:hypothetical protein
MSSPIRSLSGSPIHSLCVRGLVVVANLTGV